MLERYLGGRNAFAVRLDVDGSADVEREVGAWDAIEDLLESFVHLDELGETDTARFRAAVERGLDRPSGRVGRFGHGVFVGPLSAAAGTDWDIVFIVGAADRSLPGLDREDPLLSEALRSEVGLRGARSRARRWRFEYLAALWSAEERHVSYPRADVRGQRARFPSRWLLDPLRDSTVNAFLDQKSTLWAVEVGTKPLLPSSGRLHTLKHLAGGRSTT